MEDISNGLVSVHDAYVVSDSQVAPSVRQRVKLVFQVVRQWSCPSSRLVVQTRTRLETLLEFFVVPACLVALLKSPRMFTVPIHQHKTIALGKAPVSFTI